MARICFLLLCHKHPKLVVEQAELISSTGDYVSIHFDARGSDADFNIIASAFKNNKNICLAKREKCGWGEWSLVQGTLNALTMAYDTFPEATHFYMLSGDCVPIKPITYMHRFLDENAKDYIEHNDYFESNWIKVGLKEERLIYRHWFNERANKPLFYASVKVQRALGLSRELPEGLQIMIGSQWWCLRRSTIGKILDFLKSRPDVPKFFKTTWIPDETFFQTLVLHLVARTEVESRTLTFLSFSDYGIPTVFYADHLDFLLAQKHLFARKVSAQAPALKARLASEFASEVAPQIGPDGIKLIEFFKNRGRTGHRYGERFWERGSRIGRQNTLQVILCKKWHVGNRFAEAISKDSGVPSVGYLFDEMGVNLPDLGQLEHSKIKRNRHRRGFLKLLFEQMNTDKMIVCLDPSNIQTLTDFADDTCELRVLEVVCHLDDTYLTGHAERLSLIDKNADPEMTRSLVMALRNNIRSDHEDLQEMGLENLNFVTQSLNAEKNALALGRFMKTRTKHAEELAETLSFD